MATDTRPRTGIEHTTGPEPRVPTPEHRGRRRLVTAIAGVVVVAVAAVAVALSTTTGDEPAGRTTSATSVAQTDTAAPSPATTVASPATAGDGPPAGPAVAPDRSTVTTASKPAAAPDRSRPAGMTYRPLAVWPETLAELDRLQAMVDEGHQPWRIDPVEVARAYLVERGVPTPGMGPFRPATAETGSVDYTVAGRAGRVDVQRLLNGSIWFVTGSGTAALPGVEVDRQGASLAVVVQGGADGTLTARARRPGGDWGPAQSRQVFVGGTWSATVGTGQASGEVILQLRLEGAFGLAEIFLGPGADGVRYSALDSESRLRVDGVGPVNVGMGLEAARAASGLAMTYREGPSCVAYHTDGPPAGLAFTAVEGTQRLDLVTVSEPSVATLSGIRVGSSLADVRATYGDKLRGSVHDGWGKLVFRADDPSLARFAMAFLFSEGKVAGMWAGLRDVIERDEVCA
jgi:hypothetical protein